MTHDDFNSIVEERFNSCRQVLSQKKSEYSTEEDRLASFKSCASFLKCIPERALLGQVSKHLTAIVDFVGLLERGWSVPEAWWDEKIGDSINFLILLEALLKERKAASFIPEPVKEDSTKDFIR